MPYFKRLAVSFIVHFTDKFTYRYCTTILSKMRRLITEEYWILKSLGFIVQYDKQTYR